MLKAVAVQAIASVLMERARMIAKLALLAVLALLGLACSQPTSTPKAESPAAEAPRPGATSATAPAAPVGPTAVAKPADGSATLVIGSLEEPGNLNAISALPHHYPEHVPLTMLYDSLTEFQPDGSIGPRLAESWQVTPDGLSFTFKLTDKAKWPDGRPVTADDVKFTFDAMLNPENKASTEGVETVRAVEVSDPRTVVVTLKEITPHFLARAGSRGIIPRHLLEGQDLSKAEYNKKPVSSGPYRFVSWAPGQAIVMEANPEYWRGAPKIGRITFKIVPDQNVVLTQLRSGEIQYALLEPRNLAAVQGIAGLKLYESPTPRFFDIAPNFTRGLFDDVRVRQALLIGIDRPTIVEKVLAGKGQVVEANTSPASWAYNPDLPRKPYDRAGAAALLKEAGWAPGPDGVLQKDGQRLSFGVMINSYDRTLELALTVAQQNLKEIGVELSIDRVEPGVFNARRSAKDFDALARVWNPVYDPDQASLLKTGNFYGYTNPEVDRLATAALATNDQPERKRIYLQLQELLAREAPRLWLYTENELHVLTDRISGVKPHPVGLFWNVKDWELK
jgi:peptide/nickel transport system substrate-binding protein